MSVTKEGLKKCSTTRLENLYRYIEMLLMERDLKEAGLHKPATRKGTIKRKSS